MSDWIYIDPAEVSAATWIIIGIAVVTLIIQAIYYLYYYTGILSQEKKKANAELPFLETKPGVSVIICARDESENLKEYLPIIMGQDYPDFEVIVVNDGSTDETEELLSDMKKKHSNLRSTFVPDNAKVMSSKKLALTIGIKAAKNEILLLTDADCKPISKDWISLMVRNFTPQKDFVLGYGGYERKKGILSHLISYDTLFIAMQYMGFAIRGVPYMGVGRNMAYRKEIFFKTKGFASILHLQSGDDDLFVNNNANRKNTRIETDKESATISIPKKTFSSWMYQKERHLSTSSYYEGGTKRRLATEELSRGLFYAAVIAALIVSPPLFKLIAAGMWIIRYVMQTVVINKTATVLGERHFYLSVLIFDILLPLLYLNGMLYNKVHRKSVYKWK